MYVFIYILKTTLRYGVIKKKKMGDFFEPGTHRSTNIKVKIETL